ncbi:iron-sulfur protein [Rhizocola hellebori]|uniref:Cytochrome bc1 complex Rieske iron-sulfur subunit n=1 Tax=Rhizocola hellebori TaxID=1392758 RepID=A0A8J3Q8B0_9ACTN|nr:Rieske (2Fe-2S) protein [Rhizocola hellebori]GIH05062.1 iron-sulfur protein [Rhizocola hellebori]
MNDPHSSRRALIAGAGAVSLTGVLAACGGDDQPPPSSSGTTPGAAPTTGGAKPPTSPAPLTTKSKIPVGSAVSFGADGVIVAQPTAGKFIGFSAICTHQECVLTNIKGDTIKCGCHQSEFSAKDGRVLNGPANRSLPKVDLKIEGENISLA